MPKITKEMNNLAQNIPKILGQKLLEMKCQFISLTFNEEYEWVVWFNDANGSTRALPLSSFLDD